MERTTVPNMGVPTKDQDRDIGMDGTNSVVDQRPCEQQKWNDVKAKLIKLLLQLSRETGICLKKKVVNHTPMRLEATYPTRRKKSGLPMIASLN